MTPFPPTATPRTSRRPRRHSPAALATSAIAIVCLVVAVSPSAPGTARWLGGMLAALCLFAMAAGMASRRQHNPPPATPDQESIRSTGGAPSLRALAVAGWQVGPTIATHDGAPVPAWVIRPDGHRFMFSGLNPEADQTQEPWSWLFTPNPSPPVSDIGNHP